MQRCSLVLRFQPRRANAAADRTAVVSTLAALYHLDQATFVSMSLLLSPEALPVVKRAMRSSVPALEAEILACMRGGHADTETDTPAVVVPPPTVHTVVTQAAASIPVQVVRPVQVVSQVCHTPAAQVQIGRAHV